MIDHTNLEDYADPLLYDLENSSFEPDGSFYLSLAQQVGGSVLELGCGTGRVTIPLPPGDPVQPDLRPRLRV